ncbi:MAG: hypothetical protein K2J69_01100 [Malacoplasma sp.]|nr:hypothetical protein [Malacoplasma sp.]MDE5767173.1 hypothetical protein [Malacoplasma sp.]MDE5841676.1 hypothetical protein [Malacoplasma sp.]MDE5952852.1 hypothetical protein [Malacoplasma sp.]MDE6562794.1 hypothetical protein [Malacoplasma sp.]
MKIYISKISKKNDKEFYYYKYTSSKKINSLAIWAELLEPRFILNKPSFLRAWRYFTGSESEIVVDNVFQIKVFEECLTFFNSSRFEHFLEKIWSGYSFVVFCR